MLGMPESSQLVQPPIREVATDSDLGKTVSPFIQPSLAPSSTSSWTGDNFANPLTKSPISWSRAARSCRPQPPCCLLVTTDDPSAVATARYLWGSAQQVGLIVGGIILNSAMTRNCVR
jgi:arsenite-transporting ATPase